MIDKELLKQVIYEQHEKQQQDFIKRHIDPQLIACPEIMVISGIRRCGKSVLLHQIRKTQNEQDYFLNFDDERLLNFEVEDFALLDQIFHEEFGHQRTYYLDEIQNVNQWERFVSRLYRQDCKVFVTGSNAKMLSRELGTFLTGRHVTHELFPFSFQEFLRYKGIRIEKSSFHTTTGKATLAKYLGEYLKTGGMPQYVRTENTNYLQSLYNDILYKDVITRNGINQDMPIREMMFYLASNATHPYTYNSLTKAIGLKSSETVKSYLGFIEDTYLVCQLSKFSYSSGIQLRSPKKIYFIDNAFIHKLGFNATSNTGSTLENTVFVELKRRGFEVFYFSEKVECDFLVRQNGTITMAIQVSASLSDAKTRQREMKGLEAAMQAFGLDEGLILTLDESSETETSQGQAVHIRPVYRWLLEMQE